MQFVIFLLGLIVGILVRDIKLKTLEKIENFKKTQENKGETKFFEPVTDKEKWDNAQTVDDLLDIQR